METTLLELLAAATWARIVPSNLAAWDVRSTIVQSKLGQSGEMVDPRAWCGPAVSDAHLNFDIFNIAENGKVDAFHGVGGTDQVDGLNRAEIDEATNQEAVQDRIIRYIFLQHAGKDADAVLTAIRMLLCNLLKAFQDRDVVPSSYTVVFEGACESGNGGRSDHRENLGQLAR